MIDRFINMLYYLIYREILGRIMDKKNLNIILVSILLVVCLFALSVFFIIEYKADWVVRNANSLYLEEFPRQNRV